MLFISLIAALLLERFLHLDNYIFRFNWFEKYMELLHSSLEKTKIFYGPIGLVIAVLPIIIIVAIVYYLLHYLVFGFVGFILATAILVYCLGPRDLYTLFESYFVSLVRDDEVGAAKAVKQLLHEVPTDSSQIPRELTKSAFTHFNYNIFTVVFWFIVFGPLAAVLYRTVAEVRKCAHDNDSAFESMLASASWVLNVIEWLPIRILMLAFALVGDFQQGFSYWLKHFFDGLKENFQVVQHSGLMALGISREADGTHDMVEIKSALRLIDRALVLFVVTVALIVLGALLY